MSDFRDEFPSFPAEEYPPLPPTFWDSSYHNDSQPSMQSFKLRVHIWISWPKPEDRELPDMPRYGVSPMDVIGQLNGDGDLYESEDWGKVLSFLEQRRLEIELEEWCAWHSVPLQSADEIIHDPAYLKLPDVEKRWLANFIERWEAMEAARIH